jgi:hypothetical protein
MLYICSRPNTKKKTLSSFRFVKCRGKTKVLTREKGDKKRNPEPVFVNLFRSPGIDSQPDGPVQQTYLSYRSAMLHRQVESNPLNRFLVSLNVYKYGLFTVATLALKARRYNHLARSHPDRARVCNFMQWRATLCTLQMAVDF